MLARSLRVLVGYLSFSWVGLGFVPMITLYVLNGLFTRWTFQKPAGLSVRSVGSTSPTKWHSTRRARILCMPRESGVMTGNRVAMVGRLSRFSGKRLKLQRRLYWGLNVLSPTVDQRECWLLRDASILSWEVIRRERAKWCSFELHILFYYEENKSAINKILLFMLKTNKKKEMARVNINILGISELKWTGIGEFNSDDHYLYYWGQESLKRN